MQLISGCGGLKGAFMNQTVAVNAVTGFAVFDAAGALLEGNEAVLGVDQAAIAALAGASQDVVLAPVITAMQAFAGEPVKKTKTYARESIKAWADPAGAPIEAQLGDGAWRLLTSHPRPGGGTAFISVDITSFKHAQLTLEENEERFRCITESHPLPVWMADESTGEILYESIKASEILGRPYSPGEKQYITDHYVDQTEREHVKQILADDGVLVDHEVQLKNASGDTFWISANVRRGTLNGRAVLIAGILDITARKEREDQLRYLMESHPMPVWANDTQSGEILYMSEAAQRTLNITLHTDTRLHIMDFLADPQDAPGVLQVMQDKGEIKDYEIKLKTADGRPLWVSASARIVSHGGRDVVLAGIVDVTSRREREDQIRFILERHPLPVWMNDAHSGELIYESPATAAMFGREWSRTPNVSIHDHYVDLKDRNALVKQLRKDGVYEGYESLWKRSDGSQFWARGNVTLMEYQGREVVLAGILDVTEQKRRETELSEARELLSDAIESLSEGFALYDKNSELIMCNSHYREMNPATAHMIVPGMKWHEMLRLAAEQGAYLGDEADSEKFLSKSAGDTRGAVHDLELHYSDERWYSVSKSPTRQGGFVVTRSDITERKQNEAARRDADAVIRGVVDACPAALEMQRFPGGEFLFRSRTAIELLGERADPGSSYVDRGEFDEMFDQLERDGEVVTRRTMMRRPDDTQFCASVSARLTTFRGEQVIVSTIQDLSDRVAVEEERNRAAERLNDAIDSLSEGFALFDADERLVMCNGRYREFNSSISGMIEPGAKFETLLRASVERGQYVSATGREAEFLKQRLPGRVEKPTAHEFEQADGRWFSASRSPTREGGFVVTRTDITGRKKMEEAEREAGALVRQVLEACPVMVMMNEVNSGDVIYRSPATRDLFGEPDSVVSFYADPKEREKYLAMMKRDGMVDDFEYEAQRPNGETFRASVSGRMIEYQGQPVIVSHTVDLTDRITMEEELARQTEIVHQSEKLSALGELLAGVAHELNNPLSIVVGQSLLLKETAQEPRTQERAEKIGKAADRCARIVKTFLAMARQQPAKAENVAVNDVLESSLELAGYALRSSDIRVTLRLGDDLPSVWADRDQLAQVFTNILVNAENSLSEQDGRRRVKVVSRHDHRSGCVIVKIEDNGPGIPEEIRSRVFEPFFTTKDVGSGTGIGLAFCHRIIETHGGTITLKSKPGQQTAFFIRLPASYRPEGALDEEMRDLEKGAGEAILVVDDERDVGDLITEILRNEGYLVAIARSGVEALRKLKRRPFQLILSDLNMPNLDGEQLFDVLSSDHPDLIDALAFVTGDTMSPKARSFLEGSGRPYLEKPIRPQELRELAQDLLSRP